MMLLLSSRSLWLTLNHFISLFLFFYIILHFSPYVSNSRVENGGRGSIEIAGGLKQRGTCQRVRCWNMSWRLRPDWAQGERGDGCSLKVSGDVVHMAADLVIHEQKKAGLRGGYMLHYEAHAHFCSSALCSSSHVTYNRNMENNIISKSQLAIQEFIFIQIFFFSSFKISVSSKQPLRTKVLFRKDFHLE